MSVPRPRRVPGPHRGRGCQFVSAAPGFQKQRFILTKTMTTTTTSTPVTAGTIAHHPLRRSFERRLAQLEGVQRTGQHEWLAPCPVHGHAGEHGHTVSIWLIDEGIPVYCCHSGCAPQDVRRCLGLDLDTASVPGAGNSSSS